MRAALGPSLSLDGFHTYVTRQVSHSTLQTQQKNAKKKKVCSPAWKGLCRARKQARREDVMEMTVIVRMRLGMRVSLSITTMQPYISPQQPHGH